MAIPLIIVESPAKARTLKRFLGDRYDVRASMGHVRDLPEKEMGVEVDDGFKPHYEVVESRRKTITELRSAAKKDQEVILASDPDREGEAIAWHLVVDREDEIRKFVAVESWTVDVELSKQGEEAHFLARLHRPATGGDAKFEVHNEAEAQEIVRRLEGASYRVIGVEQKRRSKSSNPPYITSTLQQDASSRLRMRPRVAMRVAQQLYEGIELGSEGPAGLITYMRTDSTRISAEAEGKVKGWIKEQHGEKYLGTARAAKATPGVQDAHEAIRPTDVNRTPEPVRQHLTPDQYKLYDLVWRRVVGSRM